MYYYYYFYYYYLVVPYKVEGQSYPLSDIVRTRRLKFAVHMPEERPASTARTGFLRAANGVREVISDVVSNIQIGP